MNWLKSLLQHNKSWLFPVITSAAMAAGQSLTQGKINWTLVGGAALTAAAAITPSPTQTAAQKAAQAVVDQAAADVAAGAPLGSKTIVGAAKTVAEEAALGAITGPGE